MERVVLFQYLIDHIENHIMGRIIDHGLANINLFNDFSYFFVADFLPHFTLFFFDLLEIYWFSTPDSFFWNYFFSTYYTSGFFLEMLSYKNFIALISVAETPSVFNAISQITINFISFSFYLHTSYKFSVFEIFINFFFTISFVFDYIFYFAILLLFYTKWYFDYLLILENDRSSVILSYEKLLYTWINFVSLKFESFDEALCVIVIWPWCIFLVFTHIFSVDSNESFFIFIEWGLPVIYGYLLLLEHVWNFGQYIFVYLNGAVGRRSLLITILEDIVAFIILLSRVTLQVVRGLICGFFHDFFRELSEYLFDVWFLYYDSLSNQTPTTLFLRKDTVLFLIDLYSVAFILLFIYAILFLQLLFLVIAVWIFCRCWFISSSVATTVIIKKNGRNLTREKFTKLFF